MVVDEYRIPELHFQRDILWPTFLSLTAVNDSLTSLVAYTLYSEWKNETVPKLEQTSHSPAIKERHC